MSTRKPFCILFFAIAFVNWANAGTIKTHNAKQTEDNKPIKYSNDEVDEKLVNLRREILKYFNRINKEDNRKTLLDLTKEIDLIKRENLANSMEFDGLSDGKNLVDDETLVDFDVSKLKSANLEESDEDDEGDIQPREGEVYFLDDYNELKLGLLNGEKDLDDEFRTKKRAIRFFLYTQSNMIVPQELIIDDKNSIVYSNFNPKLPTKVAIHGFTNSYESPFVQTLKEAYLEKHNYNFIAVDWGALSGAPWYWSASRNTMKVGKTAAQLLDLMSETVGLKLKDVHIIGHSLGAHTAGIVSKHLKNPGLIARITGLDPALPLYENTGSKWKLQSEDAEFVDVIHTSAGDLGFTSPLGHMDFYPNRGKAPQPGCGFDLTASCSHSRSWEFFAESIESKVAFPTDACDSLNKALKGKCLSSEEDQTPNMGEYANIIETIMKYFYTKTAKKSPFSQ